MKHLFRYSVSLAEHHPHLPILFLSFSLNPWNIHFFCLPWAWKTVRVNLSMSPTYMPIQPALIASNPTLFPTKNQPIYLTLFATDLQKLQLVKLVDQMHKPLFCSREF